MYCKIKLKLNGKQIETKAMIDTGNLVKEPITAVVENETEILEQIEKRKEAKKNKDFALADQIRNELLAKGIELVDTREGTTYRIIGE